MGYIKEWGKRRVDGQTVWTANELGTMVPDYQGSKLRSALKYAVKQGDLIRLSRGIYVKNHNYSRWEMGNKLQVPSYVSLESVLVASGVIFQPYKSITLVATRSMVKVIDKERYVYRKVRDEILLNRAGIEEQNGVWRASVERAILDKIYLDGDTYFDNLRSVNWELMEELTIGVYGARQSIKTFVKRRGR